jgi:hypothetical protein
MFSVNIKRSDTIMLIIFISVCVALRISFVDKDLLQHDLAAYLVPANSLLTHFEFLDQSGQPMAFSAPLSPVLIAIFKKIFGAFWIEPIIAFQCLLLFSTGLFLKKFIQMYDTKFAHFGAYLLVFNPNSLGAAHALQTETFFTFFLFWSTINFASFIRQGTPKHLYSAILLAAIAAHIRPVGLYWAYFLPAFVFMCAFFKHGTKRYSLRFAAKHSILALICLLMLFAPWQTRNYLTFGYYDFTSNKGFYLRDNLFALYSSGGITLDDAKLTFNKKFEKHCSSVQILCDSENPFVMSEAMSDFVISDLKQTNPATIAKAELKSLIMLTVSPGTGLFREGWGIKNLNIGGVSSDQGFSGMVQAANALLKNTNPFYLAFFGLSLAFSITIKLLATIGVFNLINNERASLTLFILTSTGLLVASYMFLGQPRFRVPIEPILTYLAILGLQTIWTVWRDNVNHIISEKQTN